MARGIKFFSPSSVQLKHKVITVRTFHLPRIVEKDINHNIPELSKVNVLLNCELLSYFPVDTTMHPVLKNLGLTDHVISFVMESVRGNKVKTNLL